MNANRRDGCAATDTQTADTRRRQRTTLTSKAGLLSTSLVAGYLLTACNAGDDSTQVLELCKDPTNICVLSNGMSLKTHIAPVVLTPIGVAVRDVSTSVTSVRLEASMAGMSMPPVGVDMHGSGPSEWSGQLILPVCSQRRTDWQWTLITRVGNGEQRTRFQIEAGTR